MTDFVKITDYAAKDALLTGNPAKLVKGVEIGADFDAVAVAVATKHDAADIGVTVQAYSANLDEYAAVNPTAAGLAILDDATASDQLTTLGGTVVGKAVFTAATVAAAQQATDTEVGVDVMAYVAPGTSGNILTSNGAAWTSATPTTTTSTEQGLTQFYYPAAGSAYQDCYRAGFLPSWFNQQWGGAQWGTLPDGSFGSVATGNVQDDTSAGIGDIAGHYFKSQGFKVSENIASTTVWVKVNKVGNPSNALQLYIYTDNGSGKPNTQVAGAQTIAAKVITSKSDGEWYSVTFAYALTANTQYHLVLSEVTTDASNYYNWKLTGANKYPHGFMNDGTSAPVWSSATGYSCCFLIQNPAANSLIQSGGQFDYKLAFANGSPVNQSRSLSQPLINFYDGKNCSVLHRGTYAVSTNVWDFSYGIDHDRITLTINASGFPVLTIYRSDRTAYTVTGTGSVASGFHDVGIRVRTAGDGADYATLYVDGSSVGTPLTAQTFTMDVNMRLLGTARLGDGFGLAPTWTQDMQMTALPSAQGWTWTGTGTEANCMSIQNNKLYQNANGYTSTQTGYYSKTAAFNNATGWTVKWKVRVAASTNTAASDATFLSVNDGSKVVRVAIHEYFLQTNTTGAASPDFIYQGDFKSQDHVFTLCGKGSDYYLLIDGRLAIDGTGKLITATGTNNVNFGENNATASENFDAIWSYVKYYQGGMLLPTASTGTCSEFAHWSGDKSALFPSLYNSGTPVSVKQLCGVPRNYQFEQVVQREVRQGVTSSPTTASTTPVLATDMEEYVIGALLDIKAKAHVYSSAVTQGQYMNTTIDGVQVQTALPVITSNTAANYVYEIATADQKLVPLGLHKVEQRVATQSGTLTQLTTQRNLTVEARS